MWFLVQSEIFLWQVLRLWRCLTSAHTYTIILILYYIRHTPACLSFDSSNSLQVTFFTNSYIYLQTFYILITLFRDYFDLVSGSKHFLLLIKLSVNLIIRIRQTLFLLFSEMQQFLWTAIKFFLNIFFIWYIYI